MCMAGLCLYFLCEAYITLTTLSPWLQFERFIAIVNRNLVDSNMFIRSLMLSYEHFCTIQPEYKGKSKSTSFY